MSESSPREGHISVVEDPRFLALSTIACSVAPGAGGLGRHFDELIRLVRESDLPSFRYICPTTGLSSDPSHVPVRRPMPGGRFLADIPSTRAYPAFIRAAAIVFDRSASRRVPKSTQGFTGFASHALLSLREARRHGTPHLGLVAPNSHVDNLWRQQEVARRRNPVDRGWLSDGLRRRTILEYELAEVIFISSAYQRDTFVEFGVDPGKLLRIDLEPHPRFTERNSSPPPDTFNIAYVGRFDLIKGIPVLLDAFQQAAAHDWRLTMMGQFSSRGLRSYVGERIKSDPRIRLVAYADPLPVLETAHVYVHPSFEDGFGYAPMEAMAVGVPVIVTDQTGMSEYVRDGVNGSVVPAGDAEVLAQRLLDYDLLRSRS